MVTNPEKVARVERCFTTTNHLRNHAIGTQLCSKKSQLEMITNNFGPTVSQFTKIMLIYAHAH